MTETAEQHSTDAFWRDRSVFVTGATGLLGAWVVRALVARGARVVALLRDQVPDSPLSEDGLLECITGVRGALEDFLLLERVLAEYEIETVFHLAAQTVVGIANLSPLSTFEANIRGTYHLLEACRRSPGVQRVLVASSDKAYGAQPDLPYLERTRLEGRHPYDVSKSCADLIAQCYAHSFGTPVVITRCANLFGPGDLNYNRIVPGTLRSLLRGERPIIRSDGTPLRDYLYVEDAADAYLLLAEQLVSAGLSGEAFNLSYGHPMTVLELVNILRSVTNRMDLIPVIESRTLREIPAQYLDAQKVREKLGWHARFSLELGLQRTLEWYRARLDNS